MEEIHEDPRQRRDTGGFLAYHSADLLIRESSSDQEFGSKQGSPDLSTETPIDRKTTQFGPKSKIPRAKRVNPLTEERYILLKKFEGYVTARSEKSFTARLSENANDYPVLEAEFDLEELSETDRSLAVEGAALVWTMGYRYEGNTRKRESVIYLRRLPPWKDEEAERAKREAEDLTRDIQWK